MTSTPTELAAAVRTLSAALRRAKNSIGDLKTEAEALAAEAVTHGWEGVAWHSGQAAEVLTAAEESIGAAQQSATDVATALREAAAKEATLTGETTVAGPPDPDPVAEHLAAAEEQVTGAALSVEEALSAASVAGMDQLTTGLEELRQDLTAMAQELTQATARVEAES